MRRMRRRRRKRAGRGPLPAEQVASAQSHKVDLAGASGSNGGEEHLKRRHRRIEVTVYIQKVVLVKKKKILIKLIPIPSLDLPMGAV